jgi:hypothetical protein
MNRDVASSRAVARREKLFIVENLQILKKTLMGSTSGVVRF